MCFNPLLPKVRRSAILFINSFLQSPSIIIIFKSDRQAELNALKFPIFAIDF